MKLKDMRIKANLTQLELSRMCGCERSTITKIETGDVCPSVKLAKKIGEALGFDWPLLYEDQNNKGA